MENQQTFLGEFKYKIDEEDRVLSPSNFGSELKEAGISAPVIEKYISAYPIAEWKKVAVCNFLVRMRCNGTLKQ